MLVDLKLATPIGLPTWRRSIHSQELQTLDLAFLTEGLYNYLDYCSIEELEIDSNYRLVVLVLDISPPTIEEQKVYK